MQYQYVENLDNKLQRAHQILYILSKFIEYVCL